MMDFAVAQPILRANQKSMISPPPAVSPENWPTKVEETVKDIVENMSKRDKDAIRNMEKDALLSLHFDLGLHIRNRYGLLRGNQLLLRAACGRDLLCDPDEASMHIIEALWEALQ